MGLNQCINKKRGMGVLAVAGLLVASQLFIVQSGLFSESSKYDHLGLGQHTTEAKHSINSEVALVVLGHQNYLNLQHSAKAWHLNITDNQWMRDDGRFNAEQNTSYLYDLSLRTNPQLLNVYVSEPNAIYHRRYTHDKFVF